MHENCRRKHNGNASSSQEAAAMSKMNETPFLDPILLVSKKRTMVFVVFLHWIEDTLKVRFQFSKHKDKLHIFSEQIMIIHSWNDN